MSTTFQCRQTGCTTYNALQIENEELKKENFRLFELKLDSALDHPCYQLSKDLEKANKEMYILLKHIVDSMIDEHIGPEPLEQALMAAKKYIERK